LNKLEYTITAWPINGLPATLADRTRRIYDRLAQCMESPHVCFTRAPTAARIEICELQDGMRVLEVATGSGEMFRRLVRANQGGSTLGVDLSPNRTPGARIRRSPKRSGARHGVALRL